MHFLFVYPSPGIWGGIETQIVRMSHWLLAHGHQVTVLTVSDRQWGALLPEGVRCVALGERYWKFNYYFRTRRMWRELGLPKPDVVKSFNWELRTAWIAYQLAVLTGAKAIAGFYGLRQHLHEQGRGFFFRSFLRNTPASARIMMSPEHIEDLEARHGEGGRLWLLPVDSGRFIPAPRSPRHGHIVSVGRLGDMKGYNFYMLDVVGELIERGHRVTWTVHGSGEFEDEMSRRIQARGLEHVVTLAGAMPYERCRQVLSEAYVFVGMGTTIIEAALFGVPGVLAIANDREGVTYGPLYRVPLGSVGDRRGEPPTRRVVDEIERILQLDPESYAEECARVQAYARPYETDASMRRFLEIVDAAPAPRRRIWPCIENYLQAPMRRAAYLSRIARERFVGSAVPRVTQGRAQAGHN